MTKIVFLMLIFFISSCGIPTIYKVQKNSELKQLQCLVLKKSMYIFRSYDVCPTFSSSPVVEGKYWTVTAKNKLTQRLYISSLEYIDRISNKAKTCHMPTLISHWEQLNEGEVLYLDRYVERSDSVSANRLFLYGKWKKNEADESKLWKLEIRSHSDLPSKDRILTMFNSCQLRESQGDRISQLPIKY